MAPVVLAIVLNNVLVIGRGRLMVNRVAHPVAVMAKGILGQGTKAGAKDVLTIGHRGAKAVVLAVVVAVVALVAVAGAVALAAVVVVLAAVVVVLAAGAVVLAAAVVVVLAVTEAIAGAGMMVIEMLGAVLTGEIEMVAEMAVAGDHLMMLDHQDFQDVAKAGMKAVAHRVVIHAVRPMPADQILGNLSTAIGAMTGVMTSAVKVVARVAASVRVCQRTMVITFMGFMPWWRPC